METHFLPLPDSRNTAIRLRINRYFTGNPCPKGHFSYRYTSSYGCGDCLQERNVDLRENNPDEYERRKRRAVENREWSKKESEASRLYRKRNSEKVKQWKRDYRQRNPDAAYASVRQWLDKNPGYTKEASRRQREKDADGVRDYMRKYKKQRLNDDPDFAMSCKTRDILRRTLITTNQNKDNATAKMLGYNGETLRAHLEKHMLPGMTWENYGIDWHIDHTISVAEYIRLGVKDPAIINALSNLMPMWADDNASKGDSFALSSPVLL